MISPSPAWVWQPIADPLHIAGGAALLLALAAFAYMRIGSMRPIAAGALFVMRIAAIAAVSVLLLGPSREIPQPDSSQRPRLTFLIDTSESMRTTDCGGESRLAHIAGEILPLAQLREFDQDFRVELRGFDEALHPLPMEPLYASPADLADGRATHLAESVTTAVSQLGGSQAGDVLVVLSDGRDSEDASIQPAAALAQSKQVPIFTMAVGTDVSAVDAALLAVPMQDTLLPGEPGAILVRVYQAGLEGRTAAVSLRTGGETREFPVEIGNQSVVELQVPVIEKEPGHYEFEVSLDPLGGETELSNNSQTIFCEVVQRRIRVLILEGQPYWDTKFVAQSLRKDERVELTQITQVNFEKQETIVSRVADGSPAVPQSPADWARYDVVVLGRGMEHVLSMESARNLVQFVSDGGGQLVLARGLPYDRSLAEGQDLAGVLGVLEPVVWGPERLPQATLELTQSGSASPWFSPVNMGTDAARAFERLPGFELVESVQREKPGTLVLARAHIGGGPANSGSPAIVRMPYGKGTVIGILGEGSWRWSLLPPDEVDLRGFYDTLWSNLIRWLALGGDFPPGEQVSLQLSRTAARLGDEFTIDVAYKHAPPDGAAPRLEVIGPDGVSMDLALHDLPGAFPRYRATLTPEATGIHEVRLAAPGMNPSELARKFSVYDVNLERLHTAVNPTPLRILAEHTGGRFLGTDEMSELLSYLDRHLASLQTPPRLEYLWDRGVILTLLLMWMGIEWITRRAAGLW